MMRRQGYFEPLTLVGTCEQEDDLFGHNEDKDMDYYRFQDVIIAYFTRLFLHCIPFPIVAFP
jgi:hypothetical protein